MKKAYIFLILLSLLPLCTGKGDGGTESEPAVEFAPSFIEAMAEAEASGKPLFVYLHSQNCGYCRLFEAKVLSDPQVEKALGDFVSVQVDIDVDRQLAANLGVRGTPTIIFLSVHKVEGTNRTSADEVGRLVGFVEKEDFLKALEGVKNPST